MLHKWYPLSLIGLALLLASAIVGCGGQASPPSPAIAANPANFSFDAPEGEANPSSQTLSIWNSGAGVLTWTVNASADWLSLSPTNGSSTGETDNVTLSVDISGMDAGNYAAVVTISASEATNTPQNVVLNLAINAAAEEEGEIIDALDTERLLDIGYNYPEKVVIVEGVIVGTYYAEKSNGQPTFLDFHDPYEGYFKCIIWKEDGQTGEPVRDKFIQAFPPNPETYFRNKKVRVEGAINIYHRWENNVCLCEPEIILRDPSQIWIVE
jgi:hypothetical protein